MTYRNRTCASCDETVWTASPALVCLACQKLQKKERDTFTEQEDLKRWGYFCEEGPSYDRFNHRVYKVIAPCCGGEWEVVFNNLRKQIKNAEEKKLPTPCGTCGPKRRMKTALDGYVEKYGIDYDLAEYKDYMKKVRSLTGTTYRQHKAEINPNNLPRGHHAYHVDHKTPIIECFRQGWTPEQAAAKENLQMLLAAENLSKGASLQ